MPGRPIFLTGHSLGGALAVLAAAALIDEGYEPRDIQLYTYAQPRVGDSVFAADLDAAMKKTYFRYENASDIVPSFPPKGKNYKTGAIYDYTHAGQLFHINVFGNVMFEPPPWAAKLDRVAGYAEFAGRGLLSMVGLRGGEPVHHHAITEYEAALRYNLTPLGGA